MKYNELFRILKKNGWYQLRQTWSHVVMQNLAKPEQLIVPFHGAKEVKKGLLSAILKKAGIKITNR